MTKLLLDQNNMNRSDLVPPHCGDHILPNSPFFGKLLRHARRGRIAVRDVHLEIEKSYGELLDGVLSFRKIVMAALSPDAVERLRRGEEVCIGILAAGGYEFTVAVLTVLALGAIIVPMFPSAPEEEILYFVNKSRQVLILTSAATGSLGDSVAKRVNGGISTVNVLPNLRQATTLSALDMAISSDPQMDEKAPGVVIFTSGTTGRPKGVVHCRTYASETALAIGEGYDIGHDDVLLHVLPVHHTTGFGTSFFPFLNVGACIEFRGAGGFDAAWVWERWLQGGLTMFSAVPTIYMRLKWHFERVISKRPAQDRVKYVKAANQFRVLMCGSSALQDNVQQFWTQLRANPILTRYGATEFPGCLKVPLDMDYRLLPKGCVGLPVPGVELKLSEGDSGELLVKSPYMFAKYLFDSDATRNAHDQDGWFRTGDIARRDGHFYSIIGRASVDIIKSGGYKISAIDIERECLALPYVAEAMVVGVEDEEFGQRVGAVIAMKGDTRSVTLQRLRSDLKRSLAGYKLPTILRVMQGELPKSGTGKIQKRVLGPELIPSPGYEKVSQVQVWRQIARNQPQSRL